MYGRVMITISYCITIWEVLLTSLLDVISEFSQFMGLNSQWFCMWVAAMTTLWPAPSALFYNTKISPLYPITLW